MVKGDNSGTPNSSATTKEKTSRRPDGLKKVTSYVDILSKLVGLLTWQIIVLIAIVIFYTPLRQMVELLPEKFASSSEINVGVLSLKIQEEAQASGNEELATIITGLSQDALKWLLNLGNGSFRVIGSDDGGTGIVRNYYLPRDYSVWKELESRGLIQSDVNLNDFERLFYSFDPIEVGEPFGYQVSSSNLTPEQIDQLLNNSIELTDTGKRAYEIIITVVADMIGQE